MDKNAILKIAGFLAERLEERGVRVSKIILFGSHAAGNATEDSDIDLAVVSEDFRNKNIFRRAEMFGDAEARTVKKFMAPTDIVLMSPEDLESETSLVSDFVKQGKVVYPAQKRTGRRKKTAVR